VVAVAAGGYHSLALKNDGKVLAWGDNSTNQTSIPSGLSNVVAISSGYFHNLALASPFNVNVTNTPPFWVATNLPPAALDELTTLSATNIANDADLPPQTLTYTVTALVDTNAMIANSWPLNYATTNPPPIVNSNGVITWTPGEAQGPGVYIITAVATDNGVPPLSVTNSFTMTVNEVNLPPVLPSPPDYTINRLTPLVVNNTATDPDIPANPLTYQLSGPVGATITNGVIAWTPTLVQGGTTNVFTTIVTDTNAFALANRSLSATNSFTVVVTMSINLTGGQPQTNTIAAGGIVYYAVTVPANADFATNRLLFATAPVNVWFDTNAPPTTNRLLLPDVTYPTGTNGTVVLSTNATPLLVPGSAYYLGVQNTNSFPVTYALEVDFHVLISTNTIFISSITATNIGVTNGFRLAWFAPSNDLFQVQWTPSLAPTSWQTFTNIISYNTNAFTSPTNTQFNFFDDGSQTGGFGPERFYRLILLGSVSGLTNGVPQTNSVPSGGMDWFLINVPTNADFATNRLLSATGPVNVWFNQAVPPTGTNAGDHALLTDATNGSSVLSATSVPTNIVPGGFYWLGVQNTNGSAVTFGIEVDFHLLTSTNPPPTNTIVISSITATNIGVTNGFLLTWYAPTNDSFMVQWTTNLLPLVNWQTFTNIIAYTGSVTPTNGRFTFFDDGSQTGGVLGPQRFYRLILLGSVSGLTNGVPQTNSVSPGDTAFLLVTVPANAISASNLLISATGPVNVFFNQTHLPAGNTNAGDRLMLSATNAGTFLLASNSVPPLVPGASYYLGVQNPGTSNVTFAFQVVFGFATTNAVSNFGLIATNSGILLKWNGLTNYQYQVQWTTNLMPAVAWNTISNIVLTSTTGIFTFLDDGSLTGGFGPTKFYRLIIYPYLTPIPQTLSISSVTVTNITGTNDLVLRWSAPTNYHYGIQWTTNVSLPFTNWTVIPSPGLTLTNGVYTFVDNGQTGPPAGAKFFRLLENP
jgi:hypothetical protein